MPSIHRESKSKQASAGVTLLDRDQSILAFNARVFDWACRKDVPLLERLRYLCIVSSNLDEFFEVRAEPHLVACQRKDEKGLFSVASFQRVAAAAHALVARQYAVYNDDLMPALEASFPRFRDTFARTAVHAAQAQGLLLEVAAQDLELVGLPPVIARLQSLTRARRGNVLRHWLQIAYQTTPSTAQLMELLDQIEACRTRGHRIHIKLGAGFAERRGAFLHWYNPLVPQ